MTKEQAALLKIIEECSEIQKICSKAMRFGLDSDIQGTKPQTNLQLLNEELLDLHASVIHLEDNISFRFTRITPKILEQRLERIDKYLKYSQKLGKVNE